MAMAEYPKFYGVVNFKSLVDTQGCCLKRTVVVKDNQATGGTYHRAFVTYRKQEKW
jgi:hypothetical protein